MNAQSRAQHELWTIKKTKEPTHFDGSIYPVLQYENMGPRLKERLAQVRQVAEKVLGKGLRIWMFGSHLRGISSSGEPDIDLYLYREDLNPLEIYTEFLKIAQELPFKVDLSFQNGARYIKGYPRYDPIEIP